MSASIYQRTRPVHWDEVVGQEHVKDVLRPALERARIGHAYLFSGPRGVGKTTTARLIAMTVNCQDSSGATKPCGKCDACRTVMAGRHPDVLEIDAASNNSVDDVRDLREKVALQPMLGDKKVYILDEAHMMSKSAFNALLKTLEEPPSHAVFILATTEPERLPPTILSRCQHYRFRRLSVPEIAGKLQKTCDAEGVTAAPEALNLMARAADGAMRDGESLLERMLASGEPALTLSMVEGALGLPPMDRLAALATALARAESSSVLNGLNALYADGFAPRTITERVKIALRDLLHLQLGVGGARKGDGQNTERFDEVLLLKLIRALDEEDARFARASDLIALEMAFTKALVVAQGLEVGSSGGGDAALVGRVAALERQVKAGGAPRAGNAIPDFDPMARGSRGATRTEVAKATEVPRAETPHAQPNPEAAPFEDEREPAPNRAFVQEYETRAQPKPAIAQPKASGSSKTWGDVVTKAKAQLKAFLREASADVTADTLILTYSAKHKWHADQVASKLEDVATLVRDVMGADYAIELVMPDGSKKNSSGRNGLIATARAPVAVAQVATAVITEITTEAQPVGAFGSCEQGSTHASPPSPTFLEPSLEEPSQRPPRANVIGAPIETPPMLEPDDLAFQQLGQPNPEESLFGAQTYTALAEPEPTLEGEETPIPEPVGAPLETMTLETATLETSTLETMPIHDDPPPLPSTGLETFDLSAVEAAPPLEAFDLDFGDVSAPVRPRGPSAPSSLTGHPNYTALSKLFPHRVLGAGRFEPKAAVASSEEIPPASSGGAVTEPAAEETE
jgi:DNA polymerase III subunit gamma/tau